MNTEKNVQDISYQLVSESLKVMRSFLVHAIVELDAKYGELLSNDAEDEEHIKKIFELEMLVEEFDIVIEKLKD